MTTFCHKEIRKIAREMAGAAYEELAKDDVFYKNYPNQNVFIGRHWKNFVGDARKTLALMLGQNYDAAMKKDIFDILIKDRELQMLSGSEVVGSA